VVSRARAFSSSGNVTLRAFLDWIEGLQRAEVRDPESGSAESDEDAIHIQTIHSAKGLEYPIVLLGGLGSPGRAGPVGVTMLPDAATGRLSCRAGQGWETSDYPAAADREKDMAEAEIVRLLYVGGTRARDHLVLSLYRGKRAADSSAAAIERRLGEASPDLCPALDLPELEGLEAMLPVFDSSDPVLDQSQELAWMQSRSALLKQAARPLEPHCR
jgi:ATP-dependent exoDNAse (exonuclease V) beta subunit